MSSLVKRAVKEDTVNITENCGEELSSVYNYFKKEESDSKLSFYNNGVGRWIDDLAGPYLKRAARIKGFTINDFTVYYVLWLLIFKDNKTYYDRCYKYKRLRDYDPFWSKDEVFKDIADRGAELLNSRKSIIDLFTHQEDYLDRILHYYFETPSIQLLLENGLVSKAELYSTVNGMFDLETVEEFKNIANLYLYVLLSEADIDPEQYREGKTDKEIISSLKKRRMVYEDYETMNYSKDPSSPVVFSRIAPLYPYRYLLASADENTRLKLLERTPVIEEHYNGENTAYFYKIALGLKEKYNKDVTCDLFLNALYLDEPLTEEQWFSLLVKGDEVIGLPISWWKELL